MKNNPDVNHPYQEISDQSTYQKWAKLTSFLGLLRHVSIRQFLWVVMKNVQRLDWNGDCYDYCNGGCDSDCNVNCDFIFQKGKLIYCFSF